MEDGGEFWPPYQRAADGTHLRGSVNSIIQKGTSRAFPIYFALASQHFLPPPHVPCNSSQSLQHPFNKQVFIKYPFVLVLGKQRGPDTEPPLSVYGAGGGRVTQWVHVANVLSTSANTVSAEPSLICLIMHSSGVCVLSVLAQPSKERDETSWGFGLAAERAGFRRSQALSGVEGESEEIKELQLGWADFEDWL